MKMKPGPPTIKVHNTREISKHFSSFLSLFCDVIVPPFSYALLCFHHFLPHWSVSMTLKSLTNVFLSNLDTKI